MKRRSFCWMFGATLFCPRLARAAGAMSEMYPTRRLLQEKPRLDGRIGEMFMKLKDLIVKSGAPAAEQRILQKVQLYHPLFDEEGGSPLNFFSSGTGVIMPVLSLLFVEDLCTAYAWLDRHGYSLETIDEYVAMLQYKPVAEFPGNRYPPPLEALQIPPGAVDEPDAGQLSLRLRNSAYAFLLAHELGHVLRGHPSYERESMETARKNEAEADDFALVVLAAASEVPMGAVLYFQAAAYMFPNRGLYAAQGKSEADWEEAMRTKFTHPLTSDRLMAIAQKLDKQAVQSRPPAERETMSFIAIRLADIATTLSDQDLQQCMAVAARRADVSVLAPQPRGESDLFLRNCVHGN